MTTKLSEAKFEALKSKLRELFELDKSDLDFGIYRIMAAKNKEVTAFLDRHLRESVREVLESRGSDESTKIAGEIAKAREAAATAGFNPDDSPKVKELEEQYAKLGGVSTEELEADIYNHLLNFFSRYYDEGDFISKQFYKGDTYSIPYGGEEVALHWANKDQYYIKSGEWHKVYRFRIDGKAVHFRLVEATGEAGNNKEPDESKRRYILTQDKPVILDEANQILTLRFEFRAPSREDERRVESAEPTRIFGGNYDKNSGRTKGDQRELFCADAEMRALQAVMSDWRKAIQTPAPTPSKPSRTALGKHLDHFTGRNSFDYFVHKNLGAFLRRELDFYDPPYNTDGGPILYKNGYRSSTWASLMADRLLFSRELLSPTCGILCATIDDYQQTELHYLIRQIYGASGYAGTVAIRINPSGRPVPAGFAQSHEYAIFSKRGDETTIHKLPRTDEQAARYRESDSCGAYMWELFRKRGSNSERSARPTLFYPIYYDSQNESLRVPMMSYNSVAKSWDVQEEPKKGEVVLYPFDDIGTERTWRWTPESIGQDPSQFCVKNRDGKLVAYYKFRPQGDGVLPTTVWFDAKYSATEHGTGTIKKLFNDSSVFSYPKSVFATSDCLVLAGMHNPNGTCFDFFGGSGTTAHAVIDLNRQDAGGRLFVITEMADYFESVLLPRISKVSYTGEWEEGRLRRDAEGPYVYQRVEGELNDGHATRVLVIWRKLTDDAEKDAAVLEAWMARHRETTKERSDYREYHLIYLNGPITLPQPTQDLRTVLPTEQTFKDRMFEDTV